MDRGWNDIEVYNRKILDCLEQNLRNMDIKDAASGGLVGNEEHVIWKYKNGDLCYVVTKFSEIVSFSYVGNRTWER